MIVLTLKRIGIFILKESILIILALLLTLLSGLLPNHFGESALTPVVVYKKVGRSAYQAIFFIIFILELVHLIFNYILLKRKHKKLNELKIYSIHFFILLYYCLSWIVAVFREKILLGYDYGTQITVCFSIFNYFILLIRYRNKRFSIYFLRLIILTFIYLNILDYISYFFY